MKGCSSKGTGLEGWQCNVIDLYKRSLQPPSPPPPPPVPIYHPTYGTTCADFARRATIFHQSCSQFTDPVSCNAHYRESATLQTKTPFAHVIEPCTWLMFGKYARSCAQGDPIECTPAMVSG